MTIESALQSIYPDRIIGESDMTLVPVLHDTL